MASLTLTEQSASGDSDCIAVRMEDGAYIMNDVLMLINKLTKCCGNKFNDFPENQMTKFHAEFQNFMQNLETRE